MCTRYIVMFDFHLYWCVNNTSSCSTHIRSWCVHITSSYSTPIRINVYSLHRHVRLPSVLMCACYIVMFDSYPFDVYTLYRHVRLPSLLMCTCYIVMFDSHPYWCVHVISSYSTPIRINVYSLHRHVRLPPVLMCTRFQCLQYVLKTRLKYEKLTAGISDSYS